MRESREGFRRRWTACLGQAAQDGWLVTLSSCQAAARSKSACNLCSSQTSPSGAVKERTAASETVDRGVLLLAVYSAGLAIPFLLTALGIKQFLGFYRGFRTQLHRVELFRSERGPTFPSSNPPAWSLTRPRSSFSHRSAQRGDRPLLSWLVFLQSLPQWLTRDSVLSSYSPYTLLRRKFHLGVRMLLPSRSELNQLCCSAELDNRPGYSALNLMRTLRAKLLAAQLLSYFYFPKRRGALSTG